MDNKRIILEMLRDGKITTEEAQQLLDAIDNHGQNESPGEKAKYKTRAGNKYEFNIDSEELKERFIDMGEKISNATNINSSDIKDFGQNLGETLLGLGKELESAFTDMIGTFKDYGSTVRKNNETISTSHTMDLEAIENPIIDFKAINGGIAIKENTEDQLVKIKVKASYKAQEIETGDSLYEFYLDGDRLIFAPKYTNLNIDIEALIPSKEYKTVFLSSKNGKINVQNLLSDNLAVETQNGSIVLNDSKLRHVNLKTQNASVSVKYTNLEDLIINTSNAKIELNDVKGKELDLKTSNGKIFLDGVTSETAVFKTSNSSVNMNNIDAEKVYIKTSNGRILLSSYNEKNIKEIDVKTSNASIVIDSLPEDRALSFDLETSIGNIQVNKEKLVYLKNQHANYGMKKVLAESLDFKEASDKLSIKAASTNGSIKIG